MEIKEKDQVEVLIQRYIRSISDPINKEYDEGYIDGVVDILGDMASFLGIEGLDAFSDSMEELQTQIHDDRGRL